MRAARPRLFSLRPGEARDVRQLSLVRRGGSTKDAFPRIFGVGTQAAFLVEEAVVSRGCPAARRLTASSLSTWMAGADSLLLTVRSVAGE